MAEVGFFYVNFDLIYIYIYIYIFFFFFFCGSSFGFGFWYWFDLILGWTFLWVHGGGVGGCCGGGGRGVGFLLWVICGFMVVKVGGCCGDGGGVAMGFDG